MFHIFSLSGVGGVGKDTFVRLVKKSLNGDVQHISLVDRVKDVASGMGWTGSKDQVDREFLASLRDLWMGYNNGPREYIRTLCTQKRYLYANKGLFFLFVDMRATDDVLWLKEEFNAKAILVDRPLVVPSGVERDFARKYDNFPFDFVIKNEFNLDLLQTVANSFINEVVSPK